jgi:AcrR family transcriptional regulator
MTPGEPRRTQAERSAAMQRTLVDAATELLIERGWAATTAVAVCERAGCTRGALMHHYPSLSALLAHALESICDSFLATEHPEPSSLVDVLDRLWAAMSDRRFKAVLEAWSAAGNDPELASEITPAVARFAKVMSVDNPRRSRRPDPDVKAFVLVAREAMIGLALGRANNGGEPLGHERIVLDRLGTDAASLDARRR